MRWLSRVPAWAALAALVAVSTLVRWLAAWQVGSPWIAPDEIVYTLLGRSLWETGRLTILGGATGFYSLLYPTLVGLPLSLDDVAAGRRILQGLQALAMSLTAVPVFLWARTLVRPRWALAAAALALTVPPLAYSGLVMTETLYLPLATLALYLLARALVEPIAANQIRLAAVITLVLATRLQGLVLLPVAATALLAFAALSRERRLLRPFRPALVLALVVAVAGLVAGRGSLGAYAAALDGPFDAEKALRFVLLHAAGIVLLSGIVPALAFALAAAPALRGREASAEVRAFVAVTLAYLPWLALEVGVFAAHEIGHLAGRDLVTATPLLLVGLVLWLERGAPRPWPLAAVLGAGTAVGLLLIPIRWEARRETIHDTLELVALSRLGLDARLLAYVLFVVVAITATLLVPRRLTAALAISVGLVFAGASVVASAEMRSQAGLREGAVLGGAPNWVDAAAAGPVVYLDTGEPRWTSVWQHLYWNRSIRAVWSLSERPIPGPLPQTRVVALSNGRLVDRDGLVDAPAVVVPTNVAVAGTRVAGITQEGMEAAGLALWRAEPPLRLRSSTAGVLANGDVHDVADVTVYGCRPGRLELTLLGKSGRDVTLRLDGVEHRVVPLAGGTVWRGAVQTTASARADGRGDFELASEALFGSTRIEFVGS